MQWLNRTEWKVGIFIISILLLFLLLAWMPVAAAESHKTIQPGHVRGVAAGTATVQAVPTEDPTVTALNKEKLQHENDWWWNYGATILTSVISTLALLAGGIFAVIRYFNDRRDTREKQDAEAKRLAEDRQSEREKRAEERFQAVVEGLSSEREEAKVGAAITLRTFLRPGYEQFYLQVFDLAVANLRLPRTATPPEDHNKPLPMTTLSQALSVVFKESFPLARDTLGKSAQGGRQSLDATEILLDNAYLVGAHLERAWMPQTRLRKAELNGINLSGANLSRADLSLAFLSGATLNEADLNGADLNGAELRGANLSLANLSWIDLSGADLSGSNLSRAKLSRANLSGANLNGVRLSGADLVEARLSGAKLIKARLSGTNLCKADLFGANLSEADLSAANLNEVDLSEANLNVAFLSDANLHGVRGLTKEQLLACKAQGASIDEDSLTNSPPAMTPTSHQFQINDAQVRSDASTQDGRAFPTDDVEE